MELLQAQINQNWQIESNFENVKSQLVEVLSAYEGVIVTEDTVTESKKDVAEIRKIRTSIDDARKNVKKQWEIPYKEFEAKCKGLIELCDERIAGINSQVQVFEEQKRIEKKKLIEKIYKDNIGEYAEYLPLETIFNEKWLNATTKQRDIEYDISEKKTRVISEINIIKGIGSEIESELLDIYRKKGNNLAAAMERSQQYLLDKARIETSVKAEKQEPEPNEKELNKEEAPEDIHTSGTVTFIVSLEDAQRVKNMLEFEGIDFKTEDK